jgi:hypothetical protein
VKNPRAIAAVHEDPPLVLLDHYRLAVGGGGSGAIGFEGGVAGVLRQIG